MRFQIFVSLTLLCFFYDKAEAKLTTDGEAGIVSTTGNSRNKSYIVKDRTQLQHGKDIYAAYGSYLETRRGEEQTAQSWLIGIRYERLISDFLSAFLAQQAEGDKFAGILQRYNSDLGGKHYFIRKEKETTALTEVGYRYTHEHSTSNEYRNFQKARFYLEGEKYLNPTVSAKLWIEYLPNFTDARNWLLNSEASLSAALNTVFSLKVGYLVRYNHAPPVSTAVKTDTTFTTSLTAKL